MATSYITVRLSLRQFYSEKWWEKKAEAYSAMIDSLHHMRRSTEIELQAGYRDQELPAERKQQLQAQWDSAYEDLKRRIDVGAFILSSEAVAALREFERDMRKSSDTSSWHDHMEMVLDALRKCLDRMRLIGRRDLKVDGWSRWLRWVRNLVRRS